MICPLEMGYEDMQGAWDLLPSDPSRITPWYEVLLRASEFLKPNLMTRLRSYADKTRLTGGGAENATSAYAENKGILNVLSH